jgi:carbamoyl-phosphate synthase small subunit
MAFDRRPHSHNETVAKQHLREQHYVGSYGAETVNPDAKLVLEDGSIFEGNSIGYPQSSAGETVFTTGMVGYPETLTDPSYSGEILVFTYPLIGNYGVADRQVKENLSRYFESSAIHVAGVVVSECSSQFHHWNAQSSLTQWLKEQYITGLTGIDTRALTKRLREKGTMLGKILIDAKDVPWYDPNTDHLVSRVSAKDRVVYPGGDKRVVLVDCGCKNNIIRVLLSKGVTVIRVPWDYDFLSESFDGVLISNGPGDPKMCQTTIQHIRSVLEKTVPVMGICLGHQLMALAAGGDTYKLKFGHRSQNQPCIEVGTKRCYITSQNHGYAVDVKSMGADWEPWFINANDGTNEGIRHRSKPFMSVQFHPEATPGPVDTEFLFDRFLSAL